MHTRRKFLFQGGIATTAMLALKPLQTFAGAVSNVTGYNSYGKLTLLHTAFHENNHPVLQLNMCPDNAIVLQAGQFAKKNETGLLPYDSCTDEINEQAGIRGGYKIIKKGNIKTGIITANEDDADVIKKVNDLSAWLKKEQNCTIVVCLSQLGYQNKNSVDDITMAKESSHLDMIIGGNRKNYHQQPVIMLNNNNEEVIIHSAATEAAAFGKIDIDFNAHGHKRHVSFGSN